MPYTVTVTPPARRAIDRLPPSASQRVFAALRSLADEPRPSGSVKLSGIDAWRIRVGDYRIVYNIDDALQTITIVRVGHRRDVYR